MRLEIVVIFSLVIMLLGCDGQGSNSFKSSRKGIITMQGIAYSEMSSGYEDSDGSKMKIFLECWRKEVFEYAKKNNMFYESKYNYKYEEGELINLPNSLKNFLKYASLVDWVSIYDLEIGRRFLGPMDYRNLRSYDESHYDVLAKYAEDYRQSDHDYYLYNQNQDDLGPSGRNVHDLFVIGEGVDSMFISLISNEKSLDGEFQAYLYSPHEAGVRLKSFAHLLVHFYLHDYQLIKGGNVSVGHIYYFDGNWDDTCVPLIFDQDEIDSWGGN